jgi:hypothetical protein
MTYLKTFASLTPSIINAGGKPVIITSEVIKHLESVRKATGYTGDAIVDPENVLARALKDRVQLDVAISSQRGYEHGMAQPALLVMKNDGTVLQKWAIVPSMVSCFISNNKLLAMCSLTRSLDESWWWERSAARRRGVEERTVTTQWRRCRAQKLLEAWVPKDGEPEDHGLSEDKFLGLVQEIELRGQEVTAYSNR